MDTYTLSGNTKGELDAAVNRLVQSYPNDTVISSRPYRERGEMHVFVTVVKRGEIGE
jgi:hypothetical protein